MLLPGAYNVKAHPLDPEGVRLFDTIERPLTIRGQSREMGLVGLAHTWHSAATGAVPAARRATGSRE
jgi:lipopolysaccharide transport system ATP-binding protein